jgi:hypothetical protein
MLENCRTVIINIPLIYHSRCQQSVVIEVSLLVSVHSYFIMSLNRSLLCGMYFKIYNNVKLWYSMCFA